MQAHTMAHGKAAADLIGTGGYGSHRQCMARHGLNRRGERILALGCYDDFRAFARPCTRDVARHGRSWLPRCIPAHGQLTALSMGRVSVDEKMAGCRSRRDSRLSPIAPRPLGPSSHSTRTASGFARPGPLRWCDGRHRRLSARGVQPMGSVHHIFEGF
jgi:hypothetical protein